MVCLHLPKSPTQCWFLNVLAASITFNAFMQFIKPRKFDSLARICNLNKSLCRLTCFQICKFFFKGMLSGHYLSISVHTHASSNDPSTAQDDLTSIVDCSSREVSSNSTLLDARIHILTMNAYARSLVSGTTTTWHMTSYRYTHQFTSLLQALILLLLKLKRIGMLSKNKYQVKGKQ